MHDVSDNPHRVAGPGELPTDHQRADPPDPMDAYKNLLEAEDAERRLNEKRHGLEITGMWMDEAAQIPQEAVNKLAPRSVMDQFNDEFRKP